MKRIIISILVTILTAAFLFYLWLPPINVKSISFWVYYMFLNFAFSVIFLTLSIKDSIKKVKPQNKKIGFWGVFIGFNLVIILALSVCGLISMPFFNAKTYQLQLKVSDGDFTNDIKEISINNIPLLDRDSAVRLGDRKMGEVVDLVSQFNVSDIYTQINFNNSPVRVSPLEYAGFFRWFNNQSEGIPAYIKVDMAKKDASLVKLDEKIKYSQSEYLLRNIKRYLRFKYPTLMFEDISFEIDDSGKPYWIAPVIDNEIFLFGAKDVKGAVMVDAHNGKTTYYNVFDVPKWVDRVYPADLIITQINNWGKYVHGFWNAVISKKNVTQSTEGYNYIPINDDVWLYTGITSVTNDESNIGFVLVNLRTKETKFYSINGAEEFSAMESAQGKIQEKRYTATFPILLNIENRPTYCLSLKDNAGLVKSFGFISVENYQIVGIGDTIEDAEKEYRRLLASAGLLSKSQTDSYSGKIANIKSFVKDGNTTYYIILNTNPNIFSGNVSNISLLPLLEVGNNVNINATISHDNYYEIVDVEVIK